MKKAVIFLFIIGLLIGCSVNQRNDEISPGMGLDKVFEIKGDPYHISRTRSGNGEILVLYYPYFDIWLGYNHRIKTYITIINGRVTSIMEE